MRSKRTSPEEQLRLITECHQSGLTDYEWCQQHNIKVSTFYAWVHRLKQRGEIDIPAVIPTVVRKEPEKPDIVKIKIEGESPPLRSQPSRQSHQRKHCPQCRLSRDTR